MDAGGEYAEAGDEDVILAAGIGLEGVGGCWKGVAVGCAGDDQPRAIHGQAGAKFLTVSSQICPPQPLACTVEADDNCVAESVVRGLIRISRDREIRAEGMPRDADIAVIVGNQSCEGIATGSAIVGRPALRAGGGERRQKAVIVAATIAALIGATRNGKVGAGGEAADIDIAVAIDGDAGAMVVV